MQRVRVRGVGGGPVERGQRGRRDAVLVVGTRSVKWVGAGLRHAEVAERVDLLGQAVVAISAAGLDGRQAGHEIGRAVVQRFIEEGARVGVLDRVTARAEQLRAELGDAVIALTGDVAELADNKRAVADTVAAFGRLDIFVGNAGVFDVYAPLAEFSEEELPKAFDELFGVNVKGCFFGAKAALPELIKTEGSMVFTASVAGLNSGGGGTLYTASKHAVVGLIRQLAVEVGPRVRVNGVAPGGTITDLRGLAVLHQDDRSQFTDPGTEDRLRGGNPLQMALQPADLAGAYVFLSSRTNGRGITGTILTVDAGAMLRMPRRSQSNQ